MVWGSGPVSISNTLRCDYSPSAFLQYILQIYWMRQTRILCQNCLKAHIPPFYSIKISPRPLLAQNNPQSSIGQQFHQQRTSHHQQADDTQEQTNYDINITLCQSQVTGSSKIHLGYPVAHNRSIGEIGSGGQLEISRRDLRGYQQQKYKEKQALMFVSRLRRQKRELQGRMLVFRNTQKLKQQQLDTIKIQQQVQSQQEQRQLRRQQIIRRLQMYQIRSQDRLKMVSQSLSNIQQYNLKKVPKQAVHRLKSHANSISYLREQPKPQLARAHTTSSQYSQQYEQELAEIAQLRNRIKVAARTLKRHKQN